MLNFLIRKQIVKLPTNGYGKPMIVRYTLRGLEEVACINVIDKEVESEDLHTHPWDYATLILWGGYLELRGDGTERECLPLALLYRKHDEYHSLRKLFRNKCVTLFIKLKKKSSNTRWSRNGINKPEAAFWLKQGYDKKDLKNMFDQTKEWIGILDEKR